MAKAARVVPFTVRGQCDCACCAEREQLHDAALWHPEQAVRMCAANFLNALDRVARGHTGIADIGQLFD